MRLTNLAQYGKDITFPNIINNALACQKSGGSMANVDVTSFLNDPTTTVPSCLFGFPTIDIKTVKQVR
jgi:hypothetical protein